MPKVMKPDAERLRYAAAKIDKLENIVVHGKILMCRNCNVEIGMKKSVIDQHIRTAKHIKNRRLKIELMSLGLKDAKSAITSTTFPTTLSPVIKDTFSRDLCQAMLAADIPLFKLMNKHFKGFLEKYTGHIIPTESTIRRNFVEDAYKDTIQHIRDSIGDDLIWVSIDKTRDVELRTIVNVIVGPLRTDEPTTPFLVDSVELESTNCETIVAVFNDSMNLLWPTGIKFSRVLLFVTDAYDTMLEAASCLQKMYRRMIHLTCLARGLHQVAEEICTLHPLVDNLIHSTKTVFHKKSPARIALFKEVAPDIPLPPIPVSMRWGTWLDAVEYYCDHFNEIKRVIEVLAEEDARAVIKAKDLFSLDELRSELLSIKTHYLFIVRAITKLEKEGISLHEAMHELKGVLRKMAFVPDKSVKNRISYVLTQNPGLKSLIAVVNCDATALNKVEQFTDMTPTELSKYKYAPVVSADVERSFSVYKSLLSDQRRSFTFTRLKMHLIVACNSK